LTQQVHAFGVEQQGVGAGCGTGRIDDDAVVGIFRLERDGGLSPPAFGGLLALAMVPRLVGGNAENSQVCRRLFPRKELSF